MNLRHGDSFPSIRHRCGDARRHFIVSFPMKRAASPRFVDATPLLKEESDLLSPASVEDILHPFLLYWPGSVTAFPSDNDPVKPCEVDVFEVFEKGLDRKKLHSGGRGAQMLNPGNAVPSVFDADSPPNM